MEKENIFKGDLTAQPGDVYEYTEVTGNVYGDAVKDFAATFPNLKKAGVGLYLSALTSLPANAKLTVGGDLDLRALTSLPANAKLTVGGYIYLSALTHKTEHTGGNPRAREIARAAVTAVFAAIGYTIADGILAKVIQKRGPVSRVIICGKTEVSYVISDDEGNHAHGGTLDEARADLMIKRTSRDLTQFKSWTPEKVVSKSDAIFAYRSITGACAQGTRIWLEQRQTPEKLSVKEIMELTKGAYGAEAFKNFFSKELQNAN